MENPLTSEQIDLVKTIDDVKVWSIYAVQFWPNGGDSFNVKTKRMKKISKYIVEMLGKQEFAPLELSSAYNHVKTYLPDELPEGQRDQLENVLLKFVESGGRVIFIKYSKVFLRRLVLSGISCILSIGIIFAVCGGIGIIGTGGSKNFLSMFIGAVIILGISLLAERYVSKSYNKDTKDVLENNIIKKVNKGFWFSLLNVIFLLGFIYLFIMGFIFLIAYLYGFL